MGAETHGVMTNSAGKYGQGGCGAARKRMGGGHTEGQATTARDDAKSSGLVDRQTRNAHAGWGGGKGDTQNGTHHPHEKNNKANFHNKHKYTRSAHNKACAWMGEVEGQTRRARGDTNGRARRQARRRGGGRRGAAA